MDQKPKKPTATSQDLYNTLQFGGMLALKIAALVIFAVLAYSTIIAAFLAVLKVLLTLAFLSTLIYRLALSPDLNAASFRYHFLGSIAAPMRAFLNNHILRNCLYLAMMPMLGLSFVTGVVVASTEGLTGFKRDQLPRVGAFINAALPEKSSSDFWVRNEAFGAPSVGKMTGHAIIELMYVPFYIVWTSFPETHPSINSTTDKIKQFFGLHANEKQAEPGTLTFSNKAHKN